MANNSLQATRIRNLLQNKLYSTLEALASYLSKLDPGADTKPSTSADETQSMLEWVQKLKDPKVHYSETPDDEPRNAVLVTGTTGSLGCHLLCALANHSGFSHVYAVNRVHVGRPTLLERQTHALEENGLDPSVLSHTNVTLIELDLTSQIWDIDDELYKELNARVAIIIHSAWTVDFKLKLSSFSDCLVGLRRLLEFSLSTMKPRHLIFLSSLAVMTHWPERKRFQEASVPEPHSAVGMGYSESKWVAEQILESVAHSDRLKVTIVRAGQLSGAENGYWKATEWFPTLIRSSRLVGFLPSTNQCVSWLPVAAATRAILDVLQTDKSLRHLHLVHPHRVRFDDLIRPIASSLHVPIVPYDEWLDKLHRLPAPSDSRIISLMDYYNARSSSDNSQSWQDSEIDIAQAMLHSPEMSSAELLPLGRRDAQRWISYWKSAGHL
ncbi:hypothetical protein H0H87_005564 [Tephrocybe sp. NHM501043]|nr:hypothetical protein H0H87_005564 [Tephrocybe sp. NHM501043]